VGFHEVRVIAVHGGGVFWEEVVVGTGFSIGRAEGEAAVLSEVDLMLILRFKRVIWGVVCGLLGLRVGFLTEHTIDS